MKIIPFNPSISASQTFNVNLGELVCEFRIKWNLRASAWFCDFKTSEGVNYGVRLVENSDLLSSLNALGLKGDFRVIRMKKMADPEITYDNFGDEWQLAYGTYQEWKEYDGVR